jgi:hypothetical protein
MKSAIQPVILFAGIFFISCNQQQSPQQTTAGNLNGAVTDTALRSSWKVTGCADKAASTKSASPDKYIDYPDPGITADPYIRVSGDTIFYNRTVSHLCCRQVTVSTRREQENITITENWFRPGCKCKCSSVVDAVIHQLPKGEYQVYVIETGTDPVDDKPITTSDTLLRQKVSIR